MSEARYDGLAEWYRGFRPVLAREEVEVLRSMLGPGDGSCLDLGCGTGVATKAIEDLGWSAVGVDVSNDLLAIAAEQGFDVQNAPADQLPFANQSFDAAVSVWTHTDIDDFRAAAAEVVRVLRPGAPFVYVGGHPCFVGPHSAFVRAEGVPELHPGYRPSRRYDASAPGVANPEGLRARVGGIHLTFDDLLASFLDTGLRIERFAELGERDYPYLVALRCRR
jgi:SAM-dependent methyltransferase